MKGYDVMWCDVLFYHTSISISISRSTSFTICFNKYQSIWLLQVVVPLHNRIFASRPYRICKYVFVHAGFGIEHGSIQAYTEATRRNPSIHHEFLTSRSKWVGMKKENPQLQLRGKDDLTAARQVVLNQTQARPEHIQPWLTQTTDWWHQMNNNLLYSWLSMIDWL